MKLKLSARNVENYFKGKSVNELTLKFLGKALKYGAVGMVGAFCMYCSVQNDFKLSSSTALSIKGEGVNINITRQDIKSYLEESDREAILNMTDLIMHEEFYKDVSIDSEEDKKRLNEFYESYISENYGSNEVYEKYKTVYKLSDDYILRCMALDVKQEKKLEELEKEIEIDDESIDMEWETNKESYQYIVGDVIVFESEENANKFYQSALNGELDYDSLDFSSTQLGYGEKVYFNDSRLRYSLSNKYENDIISTYTSDGYPVVLVVSDRKVKKKQLKSDMVASLKKLNATQKLDMQYDIFQKSLEIKIESETVDNSVVE